MSEQTVIVSNEPAVIQIVAPSTGDTVTASEVSIVDAGGYYTSDNVEGAEQEIGASLVTKFDTAGRALNSSGTTVNVDADFTSTQYDSIHY